MFKSRGTTVYSLSVFYCHLSLQYKGLIYKSNLMYSNDKYVELYIVSHMLMYCDISSDVRGKLGSQYVTKVNWKVIYFLNILSHPYTDTSLLLLRRL